jgi:hypothetical protein
MADFGASICMQKWIQSVDTQICERYWVKELLLSVRRIVIDGVEINFGK